MSGISFFVGIESLLIFPYMVANYGGGMRPQFRVLTVHVIILFSGFLGALSHLHPVHFIPFALHGHFLGTVHQQGFAVLLGVRSFLQGLVSIFYPFYPTESRSFLRHRRGKGLALAHLQCPFRYSGLLVRLLLCHVILRPIAMEQLRK
jgi:hypothetical protein